MLFFTMTVFDLLASPTASSPKPTVTGVVVTGTMPVVATPLKLNTCGLPGALSPIVNAPPRSPMAVGSKVSEKEQLALAPPGSGETHELVSLKSPVVEALWTTNGTAPGFVKVMLCGALMLPTASEPKMSW